MTEKELPFDNSESNKKDGQTKCPKCGSTDISVNEHKGVLRCNFCRYEFEPEIAKGMQGDISQLEGVWVGKGAADIDRTDNSKNIMTLKCTSCGAEVVIDTTEVTQARCHWCRNMLSINNQIPNGAVPDAVLPFKVTKEEAKKNIEEFVGKRKFFANPTFKKEFTTENIIGVYMPYMSINANAHCKLSGTGEVLRRKYLVRSGNRSDWRYDADVYKITRDYDVAIHGLTIESNTKRMTNLGGKTNNVINSIMPFDMENCVQWDANYLHGYNSERRDVNVSDMKEIGDARIASVARYAANDTLEKYDRGVCWSSEDIKIKGEQWSAVYLPVWLYSYYEPKGKDGLLHYVAVNARTKETMGSVPIFMPTLIGISLLIEMIGIFLFYYCYQERYSWMLLLPGILFGMIKYAKYRNKNAEHVYETDTTRKLSNVKGVETFVQHRRGLSSSEIAGRNNDVDTARKTVKKIEKTLVQKNMEN